MNHANTNPWDREIKKNLIRAGVSRSSDGDRQFRAFPVLFPTG
jgi:hypothetical protein